MSDDDKKATDGTADETDTLRRLVILTKGSFSQIA
jgi:hypothetical protein